MAASLGRVVTYNMGFPSIKLSDLSIMWPHDKMKSLYLHCHKINAYDLWPWLQNAYSHKTWHDGDLP